jgi:hypothetical protein
MSGDETALCSRGLLRRLAQGIATVCLLLIGCPITMAWTPSAPPTSPAVRTRPTSTLPPGTPLPTGDECTARLERDSWEPRPNNTRANQTVPPDSLVLPPWPNYWSSEVESRIVSRIDGNFVGTTDEIIRWGSCKWGIDAQIVRAMAVEESYWNQDQLGDYVQDPELCVGGYTVPCPTSFGLLQMKHVFRPGSYPFSQLSTSFNVNYALGAIRGCYEGWVLYIAQSGYGPGDIWGCVGWHYSGYWKDLAAQGYVDRVQAELTEQRWRNW